MTSRASRRRTRRKVSSSYRWVIQPGADFDSIAEVIGVVSGHIFEGRPSELIGTADRATGRILRVKATYGAGETVIMNIRKDKSYSVSFGVRMTTKVGK
ncbi:hypothetical protein [Sphingopyxis granuli]|uniref:hypothetical protein n=1 Tax=Sphingopyxis granuli TaxID=267128 RepID=UPI001BB03E47|nr:hypothetical protein [Sphingopyxis granuli]QUM72176.1 hypothetical protein ICN83_18090 [Sphingopyxis granuli]